MYLHFEIPLPEDSWAGNAESVSSVWRHNARARVTGRQHDGAKAELI